MYVLVMFWCRGLRLSRIEIVISSMTFGVRNVCQREQWAKCRHDPPVELNVLFLSRFSRHLIDFIVIDSNDWYSCLSPSRFQTG